MDEHEMQVRKRNGQLETVAFDKILKRVKNIGKQHNIEKINFTTLVMKVIDQLYDGISTKEIDELTAEQCASLVTKHYDYGKLAGLIVVSNHQKNTSNNFFEVVKELWEFKDVNGKHSPLVSEDFYNTVYNNYIDPNQTKFNDVIHYERDYLIDFFGFKTLERAYFLRVNKRILERPQHMWMRVAIGIHGNDFEKVVETYNLMSQKYFTHATPTLFNAGTPKPQLSSCYLIAMENDSIDGIYNTLKECAMISKWAGGIGLHISNVRATESHIRGTNGTSNGIVPMLRVFNDTARYVDQGGGKRNGSFAIYLEPWHYDIESFLDLKKNHGDEEMRARDLFYALWTPSLFMKRIQSDGMWSLFCPDECPGLTETYGDTFDELYEKYENEKKYRKQIKARELWYKILDSQMETGTPYILYKDSANEKSNQKNLGTIKSSNLCSEIIEYSDENETAVCNLASIGLSKYVENKTFNFEKLHEVVKIVTKNLDKVIDVNFYPTKKTHRSNMLHRPIGIGVQGLADAFFLMDIAFQSEEAKELNKNIFETIYHAALEASCELSRDRSDLMYTLMEGSGTETCWSEKYKTNPELFVYKNDEPQNNEYVKYPNEYKNMIETLKPNRAELENLSGNKIGAYSSFMGSPASKGILQFHMWNVKPSDRYEWEILIENIKNFGIRNSLLVAPMPTASTSQILGNNECFEPITSNIYSRRTIAGEFVMANKYLMKELTDLNIWSEEVKNNIILNRGSIQYIDGLSEHIKQKYKTVWEMPMKHLIDMAKDRGAYVCQSQSMNLWLEEPNYSKLTSMHFYSWKMGLKTGIYYLRRKAKHQAQQFTIEPEKKEDGDCEMCSG